MLSKDEVQRYARHIALKGVGGSGQQKLKAAKVLVVGAGGLGAPVIAYLAAAGVGKLGIVDDDEVALSNLQRQIIHTTKGIGSSKAESAENFVADLNPNVEVSTLTARLDATNVDAALDGYEIVVDGTDNLPTRRLVADAAERALMPLVSGAVSMFDGQVTTLMPYYGEADARGYPGFSDLYPMSPNEDQLPSCEAVGVLGATTGVIGSLMAMEVIKLITGIGEPLVGKLLVYDGRANDFTTMKYGRALQT